MYTVCACSGSQLVCCFLPCLGVLQGPCCSVAVLSLRTPPVIDRLQGVSSSAVRDRAVSHLSSQGSSRGVTLRRIDTFQSMPRLPTLATQKETTDAHAPVTRRGQYGLQRRDVSEDMGDVRAQMKHSKHPSYNSSALWNSSCRRIHLNGWIEHLSFY